MEGEKSTFSNQINSRTILLASSVWGQLARGNAVFWLFFHVFLGVSGLFSRYIFIGWFYFLMINFITLTKKQQQQVLPLFLGYLIPSELFGRMIGGNPFLPWELGKYLGMLLLLYGILLNKKQYKGVAGGWILILSFPGLLLSMLVSENLYIDIAFNYLGLFNLCLSIVYFANYQLVPGQIKIIFKAIILGAVMVLAYSFFRTPDFSNIEFVLGANFSVTGGFGSNQVASILGLAFGLSIFLWLLQIPLFKSELLNLGLPAVFLFWALLSFSRGGVLSALLSIFLILILVPKRSGAYFLRKLNLNLVLGLIILLPLIAFYANKLTNGQLLLRYSGETYGTLYGDKEKNLSQLTTGRWDILLNDIAIWQENFIVGAGVGQSAKIRPEYGEEKIVAHVEVSRLLSEHGFLGLVISLIYLISPIVLFFNAKSSFQKALIVFAFTIAISTSMHSAMRTFITPFFYGLGFVSFFNKIK